MTTLKTKLTKKNEKGIALIFTLVMLSLLMILALSFAMDSMFSQKAAYNSASSSAAGLLAKTQLNQVLSLIEQEATNFTTGNVYSIDSVLGYSASPAGIYTDMLQERMPVSGVLDDDNDNSCLKPTVKVNWNYIRNNGSDDRIIGRAAFVVIPDEKIPLPSLLDKRVGTPDYPKHDEKNNWETRIGKYVSEINVRNAIPNTTATNISIDTIAEYLNYKTSGSTGFANGRFTAIWSSYDDLFDTLDTTPSAVSFTNTEKSEFQKNLNIRSSDDEEAFWADTNNNSKIDTGEYYRRFDLTRTDWDKTNWNEDLEFMREQILMLTKNDTSTIPIHPMLAWDESDGTASTIGLPWLALFGYDKDGNLVSTLKYTFDSLYDRRCQIAANLKDYCDRDKDSTDFIDGNLDTIHRPTSDVDPANWLTNEPSFTGNEQTPYINKIGVQIEIKRTNPATDTATVAVHVTPWVELINIYGTAFSLTNFNNFEIYISGTVEGKVYGDPSSSNLTPINFNTTINLGGLSSFSGYTDFIKGGTTPETTSVFKDAPYNLKVDITKVVIKKVVLYKIDSTTTTRFGYDYVKQLTDGNGLTSVFNDLAGVSKFCWYGWAVHDPRQNLNENDWVPLSPQKGDDAKLVLSFTSTGTGNPGDPYVYSGVANADPTAPEPTDDPSNMSSTWYDKESSSDPVNLSTAHIKNAPMESPWELGFISRGFKWQTINLKTYDADKGVKTFKLTTPDRDYIAGGGRYSSGDANILDQIKMTPDALSPQKMNLNSSALDVFIALLTKVRTGCTIGPNISINSMAGVDPVTQTVLSGTELPTVDIEDIGNFIIDKYKSTIDSEKRLTRASVVDKLLLPAGTVTADTDAKQEELIGKILNLTKFGAKTGYFTVIVLSQSIKDVGGINTTIPISKYSVDGLTSDTQGCKIGVFDAKINDPNDYKTNIYYDEIAGEQKIMLRGRSLGGGNIKIISFQYID